jgi:hypothetical protein
MKKIITVAAVLAFAFAANAFATVAGDGDLELDKYANLQQPTKQSTKQIAGIKKNQGTGQQKLATMAGDGDLELDKDNNFQQSTTKIKQIAGIKKNQGTEHTQQCK